MAEPEVLFVFPQYEDLKNIYTGTVPHPGPAYIRAYLLEQGIETAQLVSPPMLTLQKLVTLILEYQAPVVAFTSYDKSYYLNKVISQEIKKRNPNIKIVFEGPTASCAHRLIMEDNPAIDVCVRHEGELTTLQLIKNWSQNNSIDDVKGITYRSGKQIKHNPDQTLLSSRTTGGELDCLPSPYINGMLPVEDNAVIELISARGGHESIYYNNPMKAYQQVRYHSIDYILEELKYLDASAKNLNVTFSDDTFSLDVERAKEICRRIINQNLANVSFSCRTRLDNADEELFSLFVECGYKEVVFPLDTASPRLLGVIKRVRNSGGENDDYKEERAFLEKSRKNIKIAQSKGLQTFVSITLGFPTETIEDTVATLDFVKSLSLTGYWHNILQVPAGTELAHIMRKYGMKTKSSPFFLPYTVEYPYDVYDVPQSLTSMSRKKIAEISSSDNMEFLRVVGAGEQSRVGDTPGQVYIEQINKPSRQLCQWLSNNIALDTNVFFFNKAFTWEDYLQRQNIMAEALVPLVKYYQVREHPNAIGSMKAYKLNDIIPEQKQPGFHFAYNIGPFKEARNSRQSPNEVQIRWISDRESFEAFYEESVELDLFKVIDLTSLLEDFYFIEDKCRWSQCLCRAVKLQSPIIDEEECIRPCLCGRVMGNTAESLAIIRGRIKKLQIETEKRRGCAHCEVRHECSRCLFLPKFIEEKEYCEFRREYPPLHRAVEAKRIASLLMLQIKSKRIQASQMNELQISGLHSRIFYQEETEKGASACSCVRKGFIAVRLNNDFFLYDMNRVKLLRMNDKMAAIFEILESVPVNTDYIKAWLAEKFHMSGGEAEALLKNALRLLRQLHVISDI
jgi:radical SAM superfamily enzyme YgiQ (UPF0313 family)